MDLLLHLPHIIKAVVAGLDDWYTGVTMKRRLEQRIGRRVHDCELVSIRAWMSDETISADEYRLRRDYAIRSKVV